MSNKLKLRALLIDLNGTLHVGQDATPNAVRALDRLRQARIPFIFCSNSTKESSSSLLNKLKEMGFEVDRKELMTSLGACKQMVEELGLRRPLLLMSPSAREEFSSLPSPADAEGYDSVILGLHETSLGYDSLNKAFRVLKGEPISTSTSAASTSSSRQTNAILIAPHASMYMQTPATDSIPAGLSLGIGPFVRALEQAAEVRAEIVGKPTKRFFELAIATLKRSHPELHDVEGGEVGIVGDDVVNDLGEGAVQLGLQRFLVKTGKYRAGAEETEPSPDGVYGSFSELVDELM